MSRARKGEWSSAEVADIVGRHIELSVREMYLPLTDWLLCSYGTSDGPTVEALSRKHRDELHEKAVEVMVETFAGAPDTLATSLIDAEPWLLARLCYGLERIREPDEELPVPKWRVFADTIEEAARSNPAVILPQLAYFLTNGSSVFRSGDFEFSAALDHNKLNLLFSNPVEILSLFARGPEIKVGDSKTQARLDALRAAALAQKPADGT